MLQLENETGFTGKVLPAANRHGVDCVFCILKGTFSIDPGPAPLEEQLPVTLADEYAGDPGRSSITTVSDVSLCKPGTDVLLLGTAYAPDGRLAPRVAVELRVGPVRKTVYVFGDRVWRKRMMASRATEPEPFMSMPLTWERAYGGSHAAEEDVEPESDGRNPAGRGFCVGSAKNHIDGLALPNLETPGELIRSPKDRPPPAGFGAVPPAWEPRRALAGTYDEAWQKGRAPLLPLDFDDRWSHVAPPDQVTPEALRGGEAVEITNVDLERTLRFALPAYDVEVEYEVGNRTVSRPAPLDTVVIEPDENRLVLVWRASLECDKELLDVKRVAPRARSRNGRNG